MEQRLVCPLVHERRLCRPLGGPEDQYDLGCSKLCLNYRAEFTIELNEMFMDPNHQATARRKLTTLHQGDSSVEELIQEFKIHESTSRLGDVGLVDCFEQVIHLRLHENIYHLEPMPTTWAEWKHKASLLDNQWRCFQDTQPKATANQTFSFCPSSATTSTATAVASSSQPSDPAASSVPNPWTWIAPTQ